MSLAPLPSASRMPLRRGGSRGVGRRPRWPTAWTCTPTRCDPTWSGCATSGCSRWTPTAGDRRPARSTAGPSPPTPRRSASSRPPSACWPGCWPAWPPRRASATETVVEVGRAQGRSAGAARVAAGPACLEALVAELAEPRLRPGRSGTTGRRRRSPSPTARSGSWPRSFPDIVCHLHRGIVEGIVEGARERRAGRRGLRHPRRSRSLPS